MSLSERRRQFETASKADQLVTRHTKFHKLFGVSNSAKVIGRGLQLGVVNLDNIAADVDGFAFACTMAFPPADEVYFTAYVRAGTPAMIQRLKEMKQLGAAAAEADGSDAEDDGGEEEANRVRYARRNNNVVVVLGTDGAFHLRNQGFWDELPEDLTPFGQAIPVDKIKVALYPPAASARRSLLTRQFVGYLGELIGRERVHELRVWEDVAAVHPDMRRMPASIPLAEIEKAVSTFGGFYPGGELRRFHAALNFLDRKHFVILSGLSGTGKTQLAIQYAKAVHGLTDRNARDPLLFICPVRPEWTDPTGLTGYYDVLSNRYMVPRFLEAVMLATAHPDSPVFVLLDEMNLARVEYYLSDVLSCIETEEPLELHSYSVPLEGSTGTNILSELELPPNLYIIGTINVDETTNPVSDKVLDRAIVIDMSAVQLRDYLATLDRREPALKDAREACEGRLAAAHELMAKHRLGFGYRVAAEVVRYHAFAQKHLAAATDEIMDDLMVQKVLVKLRGAEKQRPLLMGLLKTLEGLPHSTQFLRRLVDDLDEFGSFQAGR
jgi:MoxR-like ATPase